VRRILAPLVVAALVAGCGDDTPSDEAQVRTTLLRFATAVEKRDYQTLCDKVFAPKLLQGLQSIGLPCEVAMRTSLGQVKSPKLTVGDVTVSGRTARAQVKTSASGQAPSTDTIELSKVTAGWRVSALGAQAGPTGAKATPSKTP
jgi:hypothetical protein